MLGLKLGLQWKSWRQTYFYQRQLISDLHVESVFCHFLPLYHFELFLLLFRRLFESDFCSFYNVGFVYFFLVVGFFFT